jgi:hypothetical protein
MFKSSEINSINSGQVLSGRMPTHTAIILLKLTYTDSYFVTLHWPLSQKLIQNFNHFGLKMFYVANLSSNTGYF